MKNIFLILSIFLFFSCSKPKEETDPLRIVFDNFTQSQYKGYGYFYNGDFHYFIGQPSLNSNNEMYTVLNNHDTILIKAYYMGGDFDLSANIFNESWREIQKFTVYYKVSFVDSTESDFTFKGNDLPGGIHQQQKVFIVCKNKIVTTIKPTGYDFSY